MAATAPAASHFLLRLHAGGMAFPPNRKYARAQQFWCAAPRTQDANPTGVHRDGTTRPAADFVASGEARMLAWSPPLGAEYVEPMADAQTLVRFLGGLPRTSFKSGEDPSAGDVVYRTADGGLVMRWPLVYSRLDSFVRNMVQPIVVLDNVPWAFAAPGAWKAQQPVGYGNNMAPENVTEYKGFVRTLLQGLVRRYGLSAVRSFAFRVGTEPDTQPAHWNDTNANFVSMYAAVAEAVDDVVPIA